MALIKLPNDLGFTEMCVSRANIIIIIPTSDQSECYLAGGYNLGPFLLFYFCSGHEVLLALVHGENCKD